MKSKQKAIPVANGSLQSRAPGAGPSRGNEQSSSQQSGFGGNQAGARGGPGAQQSGWSSRQQAERIMARGEESRLGVPQQSGYGGAEQNQHTGSPSGGTHSKERQLLQAIVLILPARPSLLLRAEVAHWKTKEPE